MLPSCESATSRPPKDTEPSQSWQEEPGDRYAKQSNNAQKGIRRTREVYEVLVYLLRFLDDGGMNFCRQVAYHQRSSFMLDIFHMDRELWIYASY